MLEENRFYLISIAANKVKVLIRRLLFLAAVLLTHDANAASFNCDKALTDVEKTICDVGRISTLDSELSFYYLRLRDSLPKVESNELLLEQRAWLRDRNDSCGAAYDTETCLSKTYTDRLDELKIGYGALLLPERETVLRICEKVASLNPEEREAMEGINAVGRLAAYDINNDGNVEVAETCSGGTMGVPCIEYKLADGSRLNAETVGYEWKTYWTFGLKQFQDSGKWFSLHSYDDRLERPAYISYMTPENKEYVLCEFSNTEIETPLPNEDIPESVDLCMNGRGSEGIVDVRLSEEPVMSRSYLRDLGRRETGLEKQGYVDYDNDGTSEFVGALSYSSGAGRGCDYNYFDELSSGGESFVNSEGRSLLLEMQGVDLDSRHPACGSSYHHDRYRNRFFEFKDIIYFELNLLNRRAILKIDQGKVYQVCSFNKSYEAVVKY